MVKFIALLIVFLILYHFCFDLLIHTLLPGKTEQSISSMSGRMTIWRAAVQAWSQRPLIGWGFNVGERALANYGGLYAISAHNGILSILLGTGLSGLIIFLCYFCSMLKECYRQLHRGNPYAAPLLGAMVVLFINNLSIPTIGGYWGQISCTVTMILIFFVIGVCPRKQSLSVEING